MARRFEADGLKSLGKEHPRMQTATAISWAPTMPRGLRPWWSPGPGLFPGVAALQLCTYVATRAAKLAEASNRPMRQSCKVATMLGVNITR